MEELGQFGEIPPLFWPGQSGRKHALPHAREEPIKCWAILTHNAYIITQLAYFASWPTLVATAEVPFFRKVHLCKVSRSNVCKSRGDFY